MMHVVFLLSCGKFFVVHCFVCVSDVSHFLYSNQSCKDANIIKMSVKFTPGLTDPHLDVTFTSSAKTINYMKNQT